MQGGVGGYGAGGTFRPAWVSLFDFAQPVCDEYHNCGKIFAVRVQCRAVTSSLATSKARSTCCASNAASSRNALSRRLHIEFPSKEKGVFELRRDTLEAARPRSVG